MRNRINMNLQGMQELERTIRRLGILPQKVVTKSAKKGATVILRAAKIMAPKDSGELRRGIIVKGEKTRKKGKKVYQVVMDAAKNDVFVKMTKTGKRYYYPASMEYGFKHYYDKIPGHRFLKKACDNNLDAIYAKIMESMLAEINKLR